MTAGHRDPGVLALGCMLVRAPPILGVAHYPKYSDAAIKRLGRYVAFVKSAKEGVRAALVVTAALLEEKTTDLIEKTATVIAESANDVGRPSPSDLGRLVNVYVFPDLSDPFDGLLTTGFCATTGWPHEHDWCSFFEVLSYITATKTTLDICIYILSCQYLAGALIFIASSNPNLKIRILTDRDMTSKWISMTYFNRSQCLPLKSVRIFIEEYKALSTNANRQVSKVWQISE